MPPAAVRQDLADLAVLGGAPRFAEPLHVGRPNIGDREAFLERLDGVLARRELTNGGPLEQEFEDRIAVMTGSKHCVAVVNATVGLQIAAKAVGLQGEVIVPSFTFVATANALAWMGLRPVFADVDPVRLTMDPDSVASLIGPETSGIVGVHVFGRTCETERLEGLAAEHGLRVLYDAAHALACSRGARMVGTFGDAEIFSFHATKFINSFEGGAITTNDDEIADRARLMRNFGFAAWDMTELLGINGKMHEVSAAMGLTSLDAIDEILAVNHRNVASYAAGLSGLEGIALMPPDGLGSCNEQHVVVRVDEGAPLARDQLQEVLRAENVLARRYFYPGCHRMPPYAEAQPRSGARLPHTERVAAEVMQLPTGTAVGEAEIEAICEIIRRALDQAPTIRGLLPTHTR